MEGKRAVSEVQAMALRAVKGRGARHYPAASGGAPKTHTIDKL